MWTAIPFSVMKKYFLENDLIHVLGIIANEIQDGEANNLLSRHQAVPSQSS
jgi:hypothetical protein